uniref:Uncharacterized protein n=1 Tax=Pyrodinium bahamense TaxID=73915 RepID=A0A7S0A9F3_9DINO
MYLPFVPLLAIALTNVADAGASPVEKVVTLLTELSKKVSQEGSREAATYDKFACFCKDATASKTSAISDGTTNKEVLETQLNDASVRRDAEEVSIRAAEQAIQDLEQEIALLKKTRHTERMEYAKAEVDLTRALQGLEAAIQALKSAKTATGLVELKKIGQTLHQAVSMAQTLIPGRAADTAMSALTQLDADPDSVYEFHADDIISTLEGLETTFREKKTELDDQETSARNTFSQLLQDKEAAIATRQTEVDTHQKLKATETQSIAVASRDLTVASAQLLDDKQYLSELSKLCNEKAVAWDQRTQARQNELSALFQATEILQALPQFLQLKRTGDDVVGGASIPGTAGGGVRAVLAPVDAHIASLVQLEQDTLVLHHHQSLRGTRGATPDVDWRTPAVALLRTKAGDLRSAFLLRLASEVAQDPFAKVKVLIQELIEKLLKEAASEATHKGWCDKQITLAEQARDRSSDSIREVNARLEVGEARRAKLASQVEVVEEELRSLNITLMNSSATREEEKLGNNATIEDAKKGRDAVAQAMDLLDKFYKEAANNATSLLEVHRERATLLNATNWSSSGDVQEDAPDVGFGGAYAGAQGAKEGIIGLLDVIKSDFERTISMTIEAEAKAEQEYSDLQLTVGASMAAKDVARDAWKSSLSDADTEDQADRGSLANLQTALDSALTELEALHAPCLSAGTSAEEKKLQREEEMEALRTVLCILEKHGVGGIEQC